MKVYISGPITGILKGEVIRSFSSAETELKEKGYTPVNPLRSGLPWQSSWEDHMKRDIQLLLDCNAIYLLPNYKQSKGAMLELSIATALQMTIINHSEDGAHTISLAEKHLNDTIEEPSRTLSQIMSDNFSNITEMIKEIAEENAEGLRILTGITPAKPASNVITNRRNIVSELLGLNGAMYHSQQLQHNRVGDPCEPIPYEKIQRRADFLHNFKDGWGLFNCNVLFRTITMLVMNGASEYDLMLELIFMIDGHTIPGTSHLKPSHKQKPTDNEAK